MKRKILFMVLQALAYQSFAGDSLQVNSFNTFRLIRSSNSWLETANSAGLVFNQPTSSISFDAGLDHGDGDYHRIREGSKYSDYSFSTESFQSLKNRVFLYGKFAFHSLDETGGQWNGTYDPYNGNPYILADSVSGTTYHKENFNLAGGLGYKLNDRISLGCGINYYVAVGAKQKDPRPQNIYMRFNINPSLILHGANYNLGVDIGYRNLKEEIDYDVKRLGFSPTFFTFKGFGFYTKDIASGFTRFLTGNKFFGGVQLEKPLKGTPTLTEVRFSYDAQAIEDGTSVIRKLDGGEWTTYSMVLNEQITLRNGLTSHLFRGVFSFINGDGNEITQNMVNMGAWNVPSYVTIGENLKFNRQTMNCTLTYNYQKLKDQDHINWDVVAGVNYINNSEKYYYIPEIFTSGYNNLSGSLSLEKNMYFRIFHLALGLNSGYTSNLSNDLTLSDQPEIIKMQRKDVYQQECDYYASSLFRAGAEVKIGSDFIKLKNLGQTYLSFKYDQVSQVDGDQKFSRFSARLGFVF